jgi:hypothetical protein
MAIANPILAILNLTALVFVCPARMEVSLFVVGYFVCVLFVCCLVVCLVVVWSCLVLFWGGLDFLSIAFAHLFTYFFLALLVSLFHGCFVLPISLVC